MPSTFHPGGQQVSVTRTSLNAIRADDLAYAFPECDPGIQPPGSLVVVMLARPRAVSKGGVEFTDSSKETAKWNEMSGKVIAVGPLSFCNRDTGLPWPDRQSWPGVGDFVRVPKYGGVDRWERTVPGETPIETKNGTIPSEPALFVMIDDSLIHGLITCNPLELQTFLG